jgi:tRNA threonylcarbamoyl adenosine modification protein (Sua5/YciO/YrdC/YwlC family)
MHRVPRNCARRRLQYARKIKPVAGPVIEANWWPARRRRCYRRPVAATMSRTLHIHPKDPEKRLIEQAVAVLRGGGVIVYPTDSCYAFGCRVGEKEAQERIRRIRRLDEDHNFTLVCRDLSQLATYARVDNPAFRLMKSLTPGPYTFLLKATHEVPRRLQNPKRKTIGLRLPDHRIVQALLEALGEPLMSTTAQLPDSEMPMNDPEDVEARLSKLVDLIIDGGNTGLEPSSVVDISEGAPRVVRVGAGDVSALGE